MDNTSIPKVIVYPFQRDISVIKPENIHYLPFEPNYSSSSSNDQPTDLEQCKFPLKQNDSFFSTFNNLISESCQNLESNINRPFERHYAGRDVKLKFGAPILENELQSCNPNYTPKEHRKSYLSYSSNQGENNLSHNFSFEESDSVNPEVESLKEQLQVQLKVNSDLKKLLVASIGDDLHHKVDALVRTKIQLSDEIDDYTNKLFEDYETLDKVMIQADLWHSKYQATKLLVERLTQEADADLRWKTVAESALVDSLNERQILTDVLFQTYSQLQLMQLHIGLPQQINAHFRTLIHLARSNYNIIRSYVSNLIGCGGHQLNNSSTGYGNSCNAQLDQMQRSELSSGSNYCADIFNQQLSISLNQRLNHSVDKDVNKKPIIDANQELTNKLYRGINNCSSQQSNNSCINSKNFQSDANCFLTNNSLNRIISGIGGSGASNLNDLKLTVGFTSSETLAHELLKPEIIEKCGYIQLSSQKKMFPRFHIETKNFGVTYDCCQKCKGDIFYV